MKINTVMSMTGVLSVTLSFVFDYLDVYVRCFVCDFKLCV